MQAGCQFLIGEKRRVENLRRNHSSGEMPEFGSRWGVPIYE